MWVPRAQLPPESLTGRGDSRNLQVIGRLADGVVESVMLACLAAVAGFGLALAGVRWFDAATQDVGKPYWMEFTMDGTVFAFIAAICLATGVLFGLAPAPGS